MASKTVTVLTPNGRRQTVKVEPNTTMLEILETVCKKHNFAPDNHDLAHRNKTLDLTGMFRFSGLPNNAQLEMVPAKRVRTESEVILVLQLEDGSRRNGTHLPSASLLEVLQAAVPEAASKTANPVMIYMRREVHWDQLATTTLKSLGLTGGRAIIRLLQRTPEQLRTQANVSAPLPLKQSDKKAATSQDGDGGQQEPVALDVPATRENDAPMVPASIETEPSVEAPPNERKEPEVASTSAEASSSVSPELKKAKTDASPPPVKPIVKVVGSNDALVFQLETERNSFEVPDSFFDVTVTDLRKMQLDLQRKVKQFDLPLQTAEMRMLHETSLMLNQICSYDYTVIRIQFPDRCILQGTFRLHKTVQDVMDFVRGFLSDPELDFHLYTTPPKEIMPPAKTLFAAKCVPQVLLHFGCSTKREHYLQAKYYGAELLSNAVGAAIFAARRRGLQRTTDAGDTSPGMDALAGDTEDIPQLPSRSPPPGTNPIERMRLLYSRAPTVASPTVAPAVDAAAECMPAPAEQPPAPAERPPAPADRPDTAKVVPKWFRLPK